MKTLLNNARYKAILDALPIGVLIADMDGFVVHANRLAAALPAEAARAVERALTKALSGTETAAEAVDTGGPRGKQRHYIYSAATLRDRLGRICGAVAGIGDASGQRQKEREFLRRTLQLESLLRHAPIGIALIDENLRYTALTDTPSPFNKQRRVRRGGTVTDRIKGHHPPALVDEVLNIHKRVLESGVPFKGSGWQIIGVDGNSRYFDWELRRVSVGKKIIGLVGTAVDVTSHVQIRNELEVLKKGLEQTVRARTAALAQANATVATILESIADGFFATDSRWHIVYFNKTAEALCGIDRSLVTGRCLWDIYPDSPTLQEPLRRVMASRQPEHFETQEICRDKWTEVSAYPRDTGGVVVSFRDITERKTTEQELLRLCSLDLVGQMAAGISHEVRNPLTTVKGYLQVLVRKAAYGDDKNVIELMISEIDRATDIIAQFLSVAKAAPGEAEAANLNTIIANLFPLLENACLEHGKTLVVHTDESVPPLPVNKNEIKQLLLNLVNNAIDAMQAKGRLVTIGTFMPASHEVTLYVSDEGEGIPAEIAAKIGTPFLTTKANGTGLGLATCYAIARRNNAAVDFTTSPDGTTFSVRFGLRS